MSQVKDDSSTENQRQFGMMYRRLQVFVISCNECFQMYLWPTTNFNGGLAIIGLLYTVILFRKELHLLGVTGIYVISLVTLFLCCSMFHGGSRSMLISRKVLRQVKACNQCKWSKRFWKSCPVIAVMMGEFHKMDRGRGPYFIRFILQRTFMLVMKTRLNVGYGGSVEISVPLEAKEF